MATQQDIIKLFMTSLDRSTESTANDALNAAIDTASSGRFKSLKDLSAAFLKDCKASPGSVSDFLREKCGIIIDNEDTGAVSGFDMGGTKIKTEDGIVTEDGLAIRLDEQWRNYLQNQTVVDPNAPVELDGGKVTVDKNGTLTFTKKGLTVKVPNYDKIFNTAYGANNGSDAAINASNRAKDKLIIVNGLYTWWIENALQLIEDSYGDNYGFTDASSAKTNAITLYWDFAQGKDKDANNIASVSYSLSRKAPDTPLHLNINMAKFQNLSVQNLNDAAASLNVSLDRTIAHEMTHAVMNVNISDISHVKQVADFPVLIYEGTAELTIGIDQERYDSIIDSLTEYKNSSKPSSANLSVVLEKNWSRTNYYNKSTEIGLKRTRIQYAGGYMLLHYLAFQCADKRFDVVPTKTVANQTINDADENGQRFTANNGTALISAGDKLVTDAENNITEITIGKADNIISTPESNTPVIVKNSKGDVLASIVGSASVHENGYIRKNLSDINVSSEHDGITLYGGFGDDSFNISGNGNEVSTNEGNDNITVGGNGNKVWGFLGDDSFTVGGNGNKVWGFLGDDSFTVGGNGNEVSGDEGNDNFTVSGNGNKVFGNEGNDNITVGGNGNEVSGDEGNDNFTVSGNGNKVFGGSGDDVITAENSPVVDDVDALNYNGHLYQLFDDGMTWDEAKTYCENLGGHLVTIVDGDEQAFVENVLSTGSKNSYWLGGYKDDNGAWQWTTNEPFSYQKWGRPEPNNHNGIETALMIYKGRNPITGDSFGRWNDLSPTGICYDNFGRYETFFGTDNFGFICEWDSPDAKNANKLDGGDGNDTLIGSAGTEIFAVGDGKDVIVNYGSSDKIELSSSKFTASVKGNDLVFTVDKKNNVTVQNAANNGQQITLVDTSDNVISSHAYFVEKIADNNGETLTTAFKDKVFAAEKTLVDSSVTTKTFILRGNDFDNVLIGGKGANTLDGSKGNDVLTGGKDADVFIFGTGFDTITDYGNGSDKVSLTSAIQKSAVDGEDVILSFNEGSLRIQNAANKKIAFVEGKKTQLNICSNDGLFNAANTAVTLNASTTEFTADSKVVMIDAGLTSNATITGNSKANKVSLGNDNVFIWTGGNDTLSNFAANDLISVTGAVTDGSVKSGNSYVKVGSNSITVKDSSQVTFTDTNGTRIFDGGIFFDEDETSATLGSSIKDFDTSDTDVVSITGNAKANKLHAGDNDTTLTGGKGNDSLWGGSGSDTFIYSKGDGTDKIFGFGEDDVLQILNADGSTGSFTKSTFANNGLTLNVAGGGKIIFDGVTSASTFNINGDTYRVDGKSIVK